MTCRLSIAALFLLGGTIQADIVEATVWTAPENVHPQRYFGDRFPRLAVPPGQTPWVFWLGGDSLQGDAEIFYSRWNGSGWDPAALVNSPNVTSESSPRVSEAADGGLWVLWKSPNPSNLNRYLGLASRWLGNGWSIPDTVWTTGGRLDVPAIAAVSQDEAWIVRDGTAPGRIDSDIYIYHLSAGVSDPEFQFAVADSDEIVPSITLDSTGEPWAVWYRLDWQAPPLSRMWFSRRSGGGWSDPESIPYPLGPIAPRIAADASGGIWVVTIAGDPSDPDVGLNAEAVWAVPWVGTAWGSPIRLHGPLGAPDSTQVQLSLGSSPGRNPRAIWIRYSQFSLTRLDMLTSAWNGTSWTPPDRIGDLADSTGAMWPDVADYDGGVWVAYERRLTESPFNFNIFGLHSVGIPTSASDASLEVVAGPTAVIVRWYADIEREPLDIHLYRALASGMSGGASPPSGAVLVASFRQERVRAGSYFDRLDASGDYDYWLEIRYPGAAPAFIGPQRVRFEFRPRKGQGKLSALPSPSSGTILLRGESWDGPALRLDIYSITGRRVRSIAVATRGSGLFEAMWDGRTEAGVAVASGIYFVRSRSSSGEHLPPLRIMLLR